MSKKPTLSEALIARDQGGDSGGHRALLLDRMRPPAPPAKPKKPINVGALLDCLDDEGRAAFAAYFGHGEGAEK